MTTSTPGWAKTNRTYIWLFNIGRGMSICIRLPNNLGIVYDLGSGDDFSPVEFVEEQILPHLSSFGSDPSHALAQLLVSHPHQDHIQEAEKVNGSNEYTYGLITLPHFISGLEGQREEAMSRARIVSNDNRKLIEEYEKLYEGRKPPLQTLDRRACPECDEDFEMGIYYLRPPNVDGVHPNDDHKYGNGVSVCLYLRHNQHSVWISGDITPEVHEQVLEGNSAVEKRFSYLGDEPDGTPDDFHKKSSTQPVPEDLFGEEELTLYFAPHHGLESCFFQGAFDAMHGGKPRLNVISEKRHAGENDGSVDTRYGLSSHSRGMSVDVEGRSEFRRKVSTQDGHHMLFILGRDSVTPQVFLRKNAEDLLAIS